MEQTLWRTFLTDSYYVGALTNSWLLSRHMDTVCLPASLLPARGRLDREESTILISCDFGTSSHVRKLFISQPLLSALDACMSIQEAGPFVAMIIRLAYPGPCTDHSASDGLSLHANTLLIDKIRHTVERFDPYGSLSAYDPQEVDTLLARFFHERYGPEYVYMGPRQLCPSPGPQVLQLDKGVSQFKWPGYCFSWALWWLDLRLSNPGEEPIALFRNAIRTTAQRCAHRESLGLGELLERRDLFGSLASSDLRPYLASTSAALHLSTDEQEEEEEEEGTIGGGGGQRPTTTTRAGCVAFDQFIENYSTFIVEELRLMVSALWRDSDAWIEWLNPVRRGSAAAQVKRWAAAISEFQVARNSTSSSGGGAVRPATISFETVVANILLRVRGTGIVLPTDAVQIAESTIQVYSGPDSVFTTKMLLLKPGTVGVLSKERLTELFDAYLQNSFNHEEL